jgi:hypothetical protein
MIGIDPLAPAFPRMARRNMARVLLQLAWRMRWDLALMALLGGIGVGVKQSPQMQSVVLMDGSSLTTLGIAVSVFVAFRNTQAINRWWESRILWGAIVNNGRSWRDTLSSLLGEEHQAERQRLMALQAVLCWLLNFELRGSWRLDAREHAGLSGRKGRLHPRTLRDAGNGGHVAGPTQILGQRQAYDRLDQNVWKSSHSAASNAAGYGIRTRVCTATPSVCG